MELEPIDVERDAVDLHEAYADALVIGAWIGEAPSASVAETRSRLMDRLAPPGARIWVVRRAEEPAVGGQPVARGARSPALGLIELYGAAPVPGLGWMLRRSEWRQGLMGNAAALLVRQLLDVEGFARIEAWADSGNAASIGVARHAGMTERGRFAHRTTDGRNREKVVMGRLRADGPEGLYGVEPELAVRDVDATLALFEAGLGVAAGFRVGPAGGPTEYARAIFGPWTFSGGCRLSRVALGAPITPITVVVRVASPVRSWFERVVAAGGVTEGEPATMPWEDVEFVWVLPDGHRLVITGPG